ncbi:MAG: hypothetical protein DLM59_01050 [Pseudonocardiales bacterium]|nr:MAG: hypothetical protein DLM59_01050 [Pseudonocardiales bacterium]
MPTSTSTPTPTLPVTTGPVVQPGEDGYEAARRGYNLSVVHHPVVVFSVADVEDVVTAVRYAAEHALPVAVQATGHGPTAPADGAVLVNTARMNTIEVDPATRTARFGAGVRSGDLVHAAAEHGLAPLNGSAPAVGAVSYHLGGGIGMLSRQFGYAADHVRAMDVVTADGQLRHVTAQQEPDLFWALRGAGKGRFGIVVAMEIDLHPVTRLHGGGMHFSAETTAEVLHTYSAWAATAPEQMGSSVLLMHMPDVDGVPAELRGRFLSHLRFAYTGSPDEGERLVRPFRDLAPLTDTVAEMPYSDVGTIHNEPTTPVAFHARNSILDTLNTDAVDTLLSHAGPDAGAPYLVELRHLGGALARPSTMPNALSRRDGQFCLYSGSAVANADEIAPLHSALGRLHYAMAPWGTGGVCLNFLAGPDVTDEQLRSAYLPTDLARLTRINREIDPTNTFRINHSRTLGR